MKRRAKILCGLMLAAIIAAALLIFRQASSRRELEAYKQQLRAQGEKLAISELTPVPPEGSREGAQTLMSVLSLAHPITNSPPLMKFIVPGHAMVAWQQDVLPDPANRVSNIWPGLSLELQANRDTLSNLQTALNAPVLYFNLDFSQGFALLLPHLSKLKQAEVLASAAAIAALHRGEFSVAWTNLHTAAAVVQRYQTEPLLISHLVRIAMARIAMATTWEFLQSDRWTDSQLAGLQSDWQSVEFFDASEAALAMERALEIESFKELRKSYDEAAANFGIGGTRSSSSPSLFDDPQEYVKDVYYRWHYKIWKHSWSYDEELYYLQKNTAGLKAIRRTELTRTFVPALKELGAESARINKTHTNVVSHYLMPVWTDSEWVGNSVLKFAEAETARRLLATAIALKRHRLRHGKYPADLNELVPEFLPQLPLDLMDGKAMRYHATPDGNFLLYSVGEDGEDNGGDPTQIESGSEKILFGIEAGKSKSWLKGRDIVWPQPANAKELAEYYKTQAAKSAPVPLSANGRPLPTKSPASTNATGK